MSVYSYHLWFKFLMSQNGSFDQLVSVRFLHKDSKHQVVGLEVDIWWSSFRDQEASSQFHLFLPWFSYLKYRVLCSSSKQFPTEMV